MSFYDVQGEKLLGSLGGMFSKTWKPKKTRPINGPVITRGLLLSCSYSIILAAISLPFFLIAWLSFC